MDLVNNVKAANMLQSCSWTNCLENQWIKGIFDDKVDKMHRRNVSNRAGEGRKKRIKEPVCRDVKGYL